MTENEQLIPHYSIVKQLKTSLGKLEEGIRKGLIPYTHYTTGFYKGSTQRREIWYLTLEQVEEAGIALRAQKYAELPEPEETRLGVTRRVYNHSLRSARLRLGLTAAQLGAKVEVSGQTITSYETLREYPSAERAQAIAEALGVSVESIFADWLTEFKLKRAPSILEDAHFSLQEALKSGVQLPSLPGPEEGEAIEELQEAVERVLDTLFPREKRVLELRFGLKGEEPLTLEQVGQQFGVTRSRVRIIEVKALRKLRHPTRARELRDFLD